MPFHIALSRYIDLADIKQQAAQGLRPRHAMGQLADRLDATIHYPGDQPGKWFDPLLSKAIGSPQLWAYARELAGKLTSRDVIYCPDEEIGLPLAALCSGQKNRPHTVVLVHNVDRPRAKLTLQAHSGFRSADLYLAVSQRQVDFLRNTVGIPAERTGFVPDQTDLNFFHPAAVKPTNERLLLVSAGLEKRDYRVFAEAAGDLDVDVRITGFSADTKREGLRFPDEWPANFSRRRYEWPELAELYQGADIVVVPVEPNPYAAGITTIVEGMASGVPVITSRTEGLKGYLDDPDAMLYVPPDDAAALREAITSLLNDPERRAAMGERGLEIARERYGSDYHVELIAGHMERLAGR